MLNPLPNDNVFDSRKLKAFAADKISYDDFDFERVENIVEKKKKNVNAGYLHFLFSLHVSKCLLNCFVKC